MKKTIKSGMCMLLLILILTAVSATDNPKPIAGYIKLANGDFGYNATVTVKTNVGKSTTLCATLGGIYCTGCVCSTPTITSDAQGLYVADIGNLLHEETCDSAIFGNNNQGDECGDDWTGGGEDTVWIEATGNTINPPQGDVISSAVQITPEGAIQRLGESTLPAGTDLPPEIISITPTGWVNTENMVLQVETNELTTCKYSLTSKNYADKEFTMEGTTRYHNASIILTAGTNTYFIQCQDESTFESSEVIHTISLDSSTPITTDNFDGEWHNETINVILTAGCGASGCEWTKYCTGNECTLSTDYTGAITIDDYTILRYQTKDNAGNIEGIQEVNIKVDTEAPNTFDNYAEGIYDYDLYITITSSCGISSCEYTKYCVGASDCVPDTDYAGAILFTETTYLRYYSKDFAGNTQTIQTIHIQIDKTPTATPTPTGGGGGSSTRNYPGVIEIPEEFEETITEVETLETMLVPSTEGEINITLPEEVIPVEKEKIKLELKKEDYGMYVILITIIIAILLIILTKRRKREEQR